MAGSIEVSKGRFVNLSGEPPSPEELLGQQVRKVIFDSKFKFNALNSELRIVSALLRCQDLRKNPYVSYQGKKVTRRSFGTSRPLGRKDEELLRFHLIGILWVTWYQGTHKFPIVNNKGNNQTPFVRYVSAILQLIDIGKAQDHLEEYQSYRKATFNDQTYASWKASRIKAPTIPKKLRKSS